MKHKIILFVLLAAVIGASAMWMANRHSHTPNSTASAGRKILYYQSSMHPWIKSDKPGKCPICGMNLVPIYEGEMGADTNAMPGMVKLNSDSITVINVQTETVTNRTIARTLHFGGRDCRQFMAKSVV
ncbi:MAG: heavy metal-binding domain-containing protein [Limisphaerales bacterium]